MLPCCVFILHIAEDWCNSRICLLNISSGLQQVTQQFKFKEAAGGK